MKRLSDLWTEDMLPTSFPGNSDQQLHFDDEIHANVLQISATAKMCRSGAAGQWWQTDFLEQACKIASFE